MQMLSKRAFFKSQLPSFCAAFCLILAIALFGGDSSAFSLFLSILILLGTAICASITTELQINKWLGAMLICWLIFTLLNYFGGRTDGAQEHYLMSLSAIAMFWLGQYSGTSSRAVDFSWRLVLIIGLLFSVFAFFQHVATPGHVFGMEKPYHRNRLTGSFLSSNTAATFLGMIVLASVAQIYRVWRISYAKEHDSETKVFLDMLQNAILPATTFLFSFVGLLLTASRAGIAISLLCCFLFFLYVLSKFLFEKNNFGNFRFGPALLSTVGVVTTFYLFWQMSGGQVEQRYDTVFTDISDRTAMAKASWTAFEYKPLFGHGLGNLNDAKLLGIDPLTNTSVMYQNASHNFYLQSLVQVGVFGTTLLSLLYLAIIIPIFRGLIHKQRYSTYLLAVLLMSFLVCAHGMFDYALEIPAVMLTHMWILGVGFSIQKNYA